MSTKNYRFETLQLHVGQEQADPATDARAVPIYQTTSYVFRNSQHAADRFGLRDAGNIYGRLTNSTQGVFEDRVAALEGGVAGLAVASGAAAITYALQNIVQNGDHIVAADNLYGGSYNLITHTLATQGITNTIINVNDLEALDAAIQPNTKVVYAETFGHPNSDVLDLEGEDASATVWIIFLVECVVMMTLECGVMDCSNFRVLAEEVDHLQGVLHMTLHAQTQGLDTLQEDEGVERRDGSTSVTQNDGTDTSHIRSSAYSVGKYDAMIRRIGLGQCGELVVLFPVELTAIDDDTTQ